MRPINIIAEEIVEDWSTQPSGIHYTARPYLSAMQSLDAITDRYGQDSALTVVLYFLANAQTWRGDVARRVKLELNQMVKEA